MQNRTLLIIGPIAPPFGGVSIHLQRLVRLLEGHFNFDYIDESKQKKKAYFNLRSLQLMGYLKKIRNADLLYINSGKNSLRIFHLCMGKLFKKQIVLTIHSFASAAPGLIVHLNGKCYAKADMVILVNPKFKERLKLPETRCVVQDAFIPPILNEEPALPKQIKQLLLNLSNRQFPIACANASNLKTHNNQDLYGLDLCIEVTSRLLNKGSGIYFFFIVATVEGNEKTFLAYMELIKKKKLEDNFFLISENLSFVKLMEMSDIVLRPTNTDGDSITVREALNLNKRILASDVTVRPEGVTLFKSRDIDDLEMKLGQIVNDLESHKINRYTSSLIQTSELKEKYLQIFGPVSNN